MPAEWPSTSPPTDANVAIVLYGAGTTVGLIAVQLLRLAGYTNVIVTASSMHHERLKSLGAASMLDYTSPSLPEDIIDAAGARPKLVIDCVCAEGTLRSIARFIDPRGSVALLLPLKEGNSVTASKDIVMHWKVEGDLNPFPSSVNLIHVRAGE